MPTLLEYISKLQREHRYRIKMAFQPSEQQLEVLERHMKKYDALEVGRPEKLMLQAIPMDFPGYGGHEVVLVDVVTRLPLSPAVLESELRGLLGTSEGTIRVIGRDEPREQAVKSARRRRRDNRHRAVGIVLRLRGADLRGARRGEIAPKNV